MLTTCPHCHKEWRLSEAQQEKLSRALEGLAPGKTLKITCPLCKEPVYLRKDGSAGEPVMDELLAAAQEGREDAPVEEMVERVKERPAPKQPPPTAPSPPDVSWLASGEYVEQEIVRDVPLAMILVPEAAGRDRVAEVFSQLGYRPEFPESAEAALERMRFVTFAAAVLHSDFEGGDFRESTFHQHVASLPMSARRTLYYVLVGPEFHTLYDLEALSYSANLVVNQGDLPHLYLILKKGLRDHEELFGPYIKALAEHGK